MISFSQNAVNLWKAKRFLNRITGKKVILLFFYNGEGFAQETDNLFASSFNIRFHWFSKFLTDIFTFPGTSTIFRQFVFYQTDSEFGDIKIIQ